MIQYSALRNVADIFKDEQMNQLIEHCRRQDKNLSILTKVEFLYSHDGDVRASGSFGNGSLDSSKVPKYTMYKIIMDNKQLMALNHLGLLEIHLCGTRTISYRDASSLALWIPPVTKGCNGYGEGDGYEPKLLCVMMGSKSQKVVITIHFQDIELPDWEFIKTKVIASTALASTFGESMKKQHDLFRQLVFVNSVSKMQPIEIEDVSIQVRSVQRLLDEHNRGAEFDQEYLSAWRNDFRQNMFDNAIAKLIDSPEPEVYRIT